MCSRTFLNLDFDKILFWVAVKLFHGITYKTKMLFEKLSSFIIIFILSEISEKTDGVDITEFLHESLIKKI